MMEAVDIDTRPVVAVMEDWVKMKVAQMSLLWWLGEQNFP